MPEEVCVAFAIKELISMGILTQAEDVLDSHRERILNAYHAYFDTYAQIDELRDYRDGIENLYLSLIHISFGMWLTLFFRKDLMCP